MGPHICYSKLIEERSSLSVSDGIDANSAVGQFTGAVKHGRALFWSNEMRFLGTESLLGGAAAFQGVARRFRQSQGRAARPVRRDTA
jgi:hypothetical protein